MQNECWILQVCRGTGEVPAPHIKPNRQLHTGSVGLGRAWIQGIWGCTEIGIFLNQRVKPITIDQWLQCRVRQPPGMECKPLSPNTDVGWSVSLDLAFYAPSFAKSSTYARSSIRCKVPWNPKTGAVGLSLRGRYCWESTQVVYFPSIPACCYKVFHVDPVWHLSFPT